jgi:hypothetical protein
MKIMIRRQRNLTVRGGARQLNDGPRVLKPSTSEKFRKIEKRN